MRILLADDHPIMRQGLRLLLDRHPDWAVVAEAENGREAVRLAREHDPEIVVMDVSMPSLNGVEATRQIVNGRRDTGVVALSVHAERRFVIAMLEAGARGYVLKDAAYEEFEHAIETVAAGHTYLSGALSDMVIRDYLHNLRTHPSRPAELLTPREREVLQLLAEGHTTKKIAAELGISGKTVETHRRRMMAKLGIDNLVGLTKFAIREGLTAL